MRICARALYSQDYIEIDNTYDMRIFLPNDIISYKHTYFVIYHLENTGTNNNNLVSSTDIFKTDKKAYLKKVQYMSGNKEYHYWTSVDFPKGTDIQLVNKQNVKITGSVPFKEYQYSLVNKFLPIDIVLNKEDSYTNFKKVTFIPFGAETGEQKEEVNMILPMHTHIEEGEYYKLSNDIIAQVEKIKIVFGHTHINKEESIPLKVEPFMCHFKDSRINYLYFTDNPPVKNYEYETAQSQRIRITEPKCKINYLKKKIFCEDDSYYSFQDVRIKYRYKNLRKVDTVPREALTIDTSNKINTAIDRMTVAMSNAATSANNIRQSISTLIYGEPILDNYINDCKSTQIYFNNNDNEKENKTMNFMKNFEFGKINTQDLKMSINGLAFRRLDDTYATYNAKENTFTDVTDMILNFNHIYVMPVSAKDLKEGDIVKHLNTYVIIKEVHSDGTISAISPIKGEEIIVIPTKNMFGFNYYSKVYNIFEGMLHADESNPFGNPFALMMLCGESGDFSGDLKSILPLMLLSNQGENSNDFMKNPLFLAMLLK